MTRRGRPGFTWGSRRCGAAAFAASFGRKSYGAAAAAHGTPPPAAPVPAVTPRCPRDASWPCRRDRAECASRRAKVILARPERRALSGLAPPASTVHRIPLRGTRLRRAVDPGDLCQPSGPDGEGQARGQARNARGETSQFRDLVSSATLSATGSLGQVRGLLYRGLQWRLLSVAFWVDFLLRL